MGSDHGHDHSSCSHGHDHGHDHEHGAGSHDHGHHGGEEFVPTSSVHDKFLLLCATICGLGFIYLGYFWMTALPLAAVTEHGAGSAHQEMLDEAGLGKGSEHSSEHSSEHATEAPKTDTHGEAPAPGTPTTEGGEHSSTTEPAKTDVGSVEPQTTTTSPEPSKTETAPATSTAEEESHH